MKVIKTNRELNTKELYALTMSPSIGKMKAAVGQRLEVDSYALYEDVNKDGDVQTILSIKTTDGDVFATNSPTFIKDFQRIVDLFSESGETFEAVEVIEGKSKAGRTYITCTLA